MVSNLQQKFSDLNCIQSSALTDLITADKDIKASALAIGYVLQKDNAAVSEQGEN